MSSTNASFLLAMSHEVRREATERMVARMTMDDRDPFDDAVVVLRGLGVPAARIAQYIERMRGHSLEMAYRVIAERFPESEKPKTIAHACTDCDASGVASYGYCKRCEATGRLHLVGVHVGPELRLLAGGKR